MQEIEEDRDPAPPCALTDQHAAALEPAIRAEGYEVLVDPESGDVKLEKLQWAEGARRHPPAL